MQRRLTTGDHAVNQHQVDKDAVSRTNRTTANNSVDANTPRTFAAVVASPAPPKPHAHTQDDESESDTITITVGERSRAPPTRPPHEEAPYHNDATTHTSGFKAARRKNIMSYFIGNIDTYSTKQDIYDYMKANKVIPTFINIFYGRNGAAAKINIHADDQEKVDNDYFWPSDIIVRKWVSKEEWEKERPRTHRRPRRQRYQHWRYNSTDIAHSTHPISARPATARTPIATDTDQGVTDTTTTEATTTTIMTIVVTTGTATMSGTLSPDINTVQVTRDKLFTPKVV